MLQENLIQNNHVTVTGKIISDCVFSHEVYGEGFYKFDIDVSRLSEASDVLPITVSERLIDKASLTIGSNVEIEGQLRSYNNYLDNKNKLVLTIFARDVKFLEDNENKNPNVIVLNGYVCKAPVYRTTPFGREISDLLVAVNRSYNKSDYIPCIAWGRNAKFCGTFNIGDNVKIWGRMQSRNYQKKQEDGSVLDKIAYEVSISKIELVKPEVQE